MASLYKYLHPDRVDVLRGCALRYSPRAALNDPFEHQIHVAGLTTDAFIRELAEAQLADVVRESLARVPHGIRDRAPQSLLVQMERDLIQKLRNQIPELAATFLSQSSAWASEYKAAMDRAISTHVGVLCLTESPDNLAMWAHYTDSHRGFVLEFDIASPFFDRRIGPNDNLRQLARVRYESVRPSLLLSEVDEVSRLLTKGTDWAYEREWRMVDVLTNASRVIGEGPHAIHLFEFPPTALLSVTIGCRASESFESGIRNCLNARPEFRNVKLYRSTLDERHYQLVRKDA